MSEETKTVNTDDDNFDQAIKALESIGWTFTAQKKNWDDGETWHELKFQKKRKWYQFWKR